MNALLGTVNALLSCEELLAPEGGVRAVVACMGAEQAAYRVALYPPYHAHRDPMPAELAGQWQKAPELLQSLGYVTRTRTTSRPTTSCYSYARTEVARGGEALMLTADRDLFGAVTERGPRARAAAAAAASAASGRRRSASATASSRARCPDFIALRGDPSDGLPGAPGIGAKTAAELLRAHDTLEQLLTRRPLAGRGRGRAAPAHPRRPARQRGPAARLQGDRHAPGGEGEASARQPPTTGATRRTLRAAAPPPREELGMRRLPRRAACAGGPLRRELDGDHVAVVHHVVAALQAQRAAVAGAA